MKRRAFIAALIGLAASLQAGVLIQSFRLAAAGQPEIFTVEFSGHDADSFTNEGNPAFSFLCARVAGGTYYSWFVRDGNETDPASGTVGVEVSLTGGQSDTDVATVFTTDFNFGQSDWTALRSGTLVTITAAANGNRTDASDVDTGMTITTTQQGAP